MHLSTTVGKLSVAASLHRTFLHFLGRCEDNSCLAVLHLCKTILKRDPLHLWEFRDTYWCRLDVHTACEVVQRLANNLQKCLLHLGAVSVSAIVSEATCAHPWLKGLLQSNGDGLDRIPVMGSQSSHTQLYRLYCIGLVATPNMVDCERLHRRMSNHDGNMQSRMLDSHLSQRLKLCLNSPAIDGDTFDSFTNAVADELHRQCPTMRPK